MPSCWRTGALERPSPPRATAAARFPVRGETGDRDTSRSVKQFLGIRFGFKIEPPTTQEAAPRDRLRRGGLWQRAPGRRTEELGGTRSVGPLRSARAKYSTHRIFFRRRGLWGDPSLFSGAMSHPGSIVTLAAIAVAPGVAHPPRAGVAAQSHRLSHCLLAGDPGGGSKRKGL